MDPPLVATLLERFLQLARSRESQNLDALECNEETWSYADLDTVSTSLAEDIRNSYGERPIVAIVSENHPYVLATILATWKLGGIAAPIDYHTPKEILAAMVLDIKPTCVLIPSSEVATRQIMSDLCIPLLPFEPKASTILALTQKYIDWSPCDTRQSQFHPLPEDIGMYLHTSSASSVSNIKCVPLTHKNIFAGAFARLRWWQKTWPDKDFENLKVLGWSPWSHIIGVSHDLGAAMLLTGGCYIFAARPSSYPNEYSNKIQDASLDVISQLLHMAVRKSTTAFAGVPWVLEGIMAKWNGEGKAIVDQALANFKIFGLGGAATSPECLSWSKEHGIPLIIDIGMTELGGPLFHSTYSDTVGWPISDCLVADGELNLVDENGEVTLEEGELHISSQSISKGYLRPNYLAFTVAPSGRVTLRTGDIYQFVGEGRLIWRGRKEDFIQMSSGETLDPRMIEQSLDRSLAVHRSCVVGDNFLRGASRVVCAILELSPTDTRGYHSALAEVTREIAAANRLLPPPLRISWSRVMILDQDQHIPVTRKGAVFRKMLEDVFGVQLRSLLSGTEEQPLAFAPPSITDTKANDEQFTEDSVPLRLAEIVAAELHLEKAVLKENYNATFAELGMDSSMATKMVNAINKCFGLSLPLNTCHTYIDLNTLTSAIISELGLTPEASSPATTSPSSYSPSSVIEEVVIVGQALRLPGNINGPEEFWDALVEKRDDIIGPIPADRWDHASFYRAPDSDREESPCDITLDKAGFISITDFDHTFFGISSAEAYHVAPNIRLTLEIAFEALENANIPISRLKGSDMGVFVAANMDEGHIKLLFAEKGWGAYTRFYGTGVATSTACGRLSYLLDVHGPSYTIDTACSSGLVGFDQAVRYLQSGQGEAAIVCGANTHSWPGGFGFLSAQKMTSPNSRCATYTDMADGYVPSEGAAAVVIKTKKAALRDGDKILAVVRSTTTMHDGRSQGLVAPNVKAQIMMQRSLLRQAGLDPAQVDFVEAHGTGTSLGDLIEVEGINEVFKASHSQTRPLIIGAAKTCVGHTETVAGLIGLLKIVGSFSNLAVPGLAHLTSKNMNPSLDCGVVPIRIPWKTTPLLRSMVTKEPLRGMVLSNGFAGTISGAILEELDTGFSQYGSEGLSDRPSESSNNSSWIRLDSERVTSSSPFTPSRTPSPISSPGTPDVPASRLFVISAKSPAALKAYVEKYIDFCETSCPNLFESICYTSCIGREHYRYRFSCVADNMADLINQLKQSLSDNEVSSKPILRSVAFAFPGQGSQYQGMARDLSILFPAFQSVLAAASAQASELTNLPIMSYLVDVDPPAGRTLSDSDVAQVCIFIYQYCISKWFQDLGLIPCAVVGHSLGEIAAAVIAGSFTFSTALEFVVKRASVLRPDVMHPAGMAAVAASPEVVNSYLDNLFLRDRLSIAVYNAEESIVVSGGLEAIEVLVSTVKQEGLKATKLEVNQAFHSPYVAASLPALRKWLLDREGALASLKVPFYSSASGRQVHKGDRLDTNYWINHALNPVLFLDAAKALSRDRSIDAVLDLGPQPFIWTQFQTGSLSSKQSFSVVGKRGKCQSTAFFTLLSQLFQHGFEIDFSKLFLDGPSSGSKASLPTYPFQRIHNYPTYIPSRNRALPTATAPEEQLPVTTPFRIDEILCEILKEHRIDGIRIVPGAAFADFFASSVSSKCLEELRFHQPLVAEKPDDTVVGVVEQGAFTMLQGTSKICSGKIAIGNPPSVPAWTDDDRLPLRIVKNSKVYECFKHVNFGPSFRNIHEIKLWDDHADAFVSVTETTNSVQDRIRKLDACMHMFGAIAEITLPELTAMDGVFLPSSLHGFRLHSESLPSTFVVRYLLPVTVARGSQILSVQLAVYSLTGQLLLSCQKYSVAFIPSGVAVPKSPEQTSKWMKNAWTSKPLPLSQTKLAQVDEMLYIGVESNPPLLRRLQEIASHTIFVQLPTSPTLSNESIQLANIFNKNTRLSVVLDLGSFEPEPGSDIQFAVCQQILSLLKLLMTSGAHITSFLSLSFDSIPIHTPELATRHNPRPGSIIGSIVHGMLRVFKRENSLDSVTWSLDLPSLQQLQSETAKSIILSEIAARNGKSTCDGLVAYRFVEQGNSTPTRLVPSLQMEVAVARPSFIGVAVIAGIGSIGVALASGLVESGVESVVFMGRREANSQSILDEFSQMNPGLRAKSSYRQVDITDKVQLEESLKDIQNELGSIRHIILCAAVMRDAAIPNISPVDFAEVLRPKVCGGWNLHLLSQKLALTLDSFVVLSSTNVLVGNPGQLAYVSANSFLDHLSRLRRNIGLPGVSIQLGAWESRLTDNLNMKKSFALKMTSEQGVPLILQAMSTNHPVQVVADFDIPKLLSVPAYSTDPFFASILPTPTSVTPVTSAFASVAPTVASASTKDVNAKVMAILRSVMELRPTETLDLGSSLNACGGDSITFAQLRGRILKELRVDLPAMFLGEAYTMGDIVDFAVKGASG